MYLPHVVFILILQCLCLILIPHSLSHVSFPHTPCLMSHVSCRIPAYSMSHVSCLMSHSRILHVPCLMSHSRILHVPCLMLHSRILHVSCLMSHVSFLQATLHARIGRKHVQTMVSTSELATTQGRVSCKHVFTCCFVVFVFVSCL